MTIGEDRNKDRLTALQCLNAPVVPPQIDKAHAKSRLLYQSVYQSPCSVLSLVNTTPRPKVLFLRYLL